MELEWLILPGVVLGSILLWRMRHKKSSQKDNAKGSTVVEEIQPRRATAGHLGARTLRERREVLGKINPK